MQFAMRNVVIVRAEAITAVTVEVERGATVH
jgi:hypothetical protein